MLVGTVSIETSEIISELLNKKGIPHNVFNAKYHAEEAEIIARAGQKGSVTIATNMAGRGTDIMLGEGVKKLGGLAVIGTERHESRRIDNQLRGRAGRQGDPGSSQFYLSLEDELMRRFGSDNMKAMMASLGWMMISRLRAEWFPKPLNLLKERVEGNNFDARKQLLQYDDVMHQQREIIYAQRNEVLESENLRSIVERMIMSSLERNVAAHDLTSDDQEQWSKSAQSILDYVSGNLLHEGDITLDDLRGKDTEEVIELIFAKVKDHYDEKEEQLGEERMREFEKVIVLRAVDSKWIDHIDMMDQLRQGIHLRAYGQINPLREYQHEGFAMFELMVEAIEEDTAKYIMKAEIRQNLERQEVATGHAVNPKEDGEKAKKKPVIKKDAIGRNEPCPCGSGKKYKNCHGKFE